MSVHFPVIPKFLSDYRFYKFLTELKIYQEHFNNSMSLYIIIFEYSNKSNKSKSDSMVQIR